MRTRFVLSEPAVKNVRVFLLFTMTTSIKIALVKVKEAAKQVPPLRLKRGEGVQVLVVGPPVEEPFFMASLSKRTKS